MGRLIPTYMWMFILCFLLITPDVSLSQQAKRKPENAQTPTISPTHLITKPKTQPTTKPVVRSVAAKTKIGIEKITISPKKPISGNTIKAQISLLNKGSQTIKAIEFILQLDKKKNIYHHTIALPAGKITTIKTDFTVTDSGTYSITASLTPPQGTTIRKTKSFTVFKPAQSAKPTLSKSRQNSIKSQLLVIDFTLSKAKITKGETVILSAVFRLLGSPSQKNFFVQFYDGRKPIGSRQTVIIKPGRTTARIKQPFKAQTPGAHKLRVIGQFSPGNIKKSTHTNSQQKNLIVTSKPPVQLLTKIPGKVKPLPIDRNKKAFAPLPHKASRVPIKTLKSNNDGGNGNIQYNLTRSIEIISPKQGDFLTLGAPVDIVWNVKGDLGSNCMTISLYKKMSGGGAPLHVTYINGQYLDTRQGNSTHYQQGYTWNIQPTPSLQGPVYFVRVETCDKSVTDDSGDILFPGMHPEFSVNNLHTSPVSSYVGDTLNIRANIVNMGGLNSSYNQTFLLDMLVKDPGGNPVVQQTFDSALMGAPPLGFGGRYQFSTDFTPTKKGAHTVHLTVQSYPAGEIMDKFQENNSRTATFTVNNKQPDLVACFKKYNVSPKNTKSYYPVKIRNIGNKISAECRLRFQISDRGTKTYTIPPVEPGQEHGIQRAIYWGAKLAVHPFQIRISCPQESDEIHTNNVFDGFIKVPRSMNDTGGWSNSQTICTDGTAYVHPPYSGGTVTN